MMKGIFITFNLLIINVLFLNAQGFEWANFISSTGYIEVTDIKTDVNGNLYGVGNFQGTVDFDPGSGIYNLTSTSNSPDLFIIKLDSTGSIIWVKVCEIMGHTTRTTSFIFDNNDDLLICGNFSYSGDFDPGPGVYTLNGLDDNQFILKLDANGNFLWAKNFGGTGMNYSHSIAVDVQNHIYITGLLNSPSDMDPGSGIFILNEGTFILKLDSSANFIWAKSISGAVGIYIRIDQSNHILVSGDFENTVDFDPGPSVNYHTSNGMQDQFILNLNSLGEFNWVKTFGGINEEELRGFQNDNDGNIIVTGNFVGSIDFDPGSNVYILQSGISSIYLLKLDLNGNFVWASSIGNSLGY